MSNTVYTNARVVTEHETFLGAVAVCNGRITGVDRGAAGRYAGCRVLDMRGDYLLPGMVDVHTDSLERQFTPRHGVYWPSPMAAAVANDALLNGCGITTAFDSLCAEAFPEEETRRRMFNDSIRAVSTGEAQGLFRSRHFLHLRCETADPKNLVILERHLENRLVRLASLMDHTPGQRQYKDVDKFRTYHAAQQWTDSEFSEVVRKLKDDQRLHAERQRKEILRRCRQYGVPVASHDDADKQHVEQALSEGISISEFPTTALAAGLASEKGMQVVMGAPNIVLGGSHSGNVSALDVFMAGHLDVLASDYAPMSLLPAPFMLSRKTGKPLHECVRLVTANPARMIGLDGTGVIDQGFRADMIRVRLVAGEPVVVGVATG